MQTHPARPDLAALHATADTATDMFGRTTHLPHSESRAHGPSLRDEVCPDILQRRLERHVGGLVRKSRSRCRPAAEVREGLPGAKVRRCGRADAAVLVAPGEVRGAGARAREDDPGILCALNRVFVEVLPHPTSADGVGEGGCHVAVEHPQSLSI
jgi:hypothetical protein